MRLQIVERHTDRRGLAAKAVIAILWAIGLAAAVWAAVGVMTRGVTFLAVFARYTPWIMLGLAGLGVLLAVSAGYALWTRGGAPRYPAFFRSTAAGVLVLYLLAALLLVIGVLQYDVAAAPPVRADQFGVAVAEFDGGDAFAAPAAGRESAAVVARGLRQAFQSSPDLRGRVTVVSAPLITTDADARDFAARNGVQIIIRGRITDGTQQAFVPAVAVLEAPSFQLRYGDVPASHDASLTGDGSLDYGELRPDQAGSFVNYVTGLVHLSRSSYRPARDALQRAIDAVLREAPSQSAERARRLSLLHHALGRANERLGDAGAARTQYQLALEQDPGYAAPHIGLGNLDYQQGDCAAALQAYEQATRLGPSLSVSWYSRGNAYYCLQQYESAVKDYQAAIRLAPSGQETVTIYNLVLGMTLCQTGKTAEGLAQLSLAQAGNLVHSADSESRNCLRQGLTAMADAVAAQQARALAETSPGGLPSGSLEPTLVANEPTQSAPPFLAVLLTAIPGGDRIGSPTPDEELILLAPTETATPVPAASTTPESIATASSTITPNPSATNTPPQATRQPTAEPPPAPSWTPPSPTDTPAPTATSAPPTPLPTVTQGPPPLTKAPTATQPPPTLTRAPTATKAPPTPTPVPPTATRVPTATQAPPTSTPVPPTSPPPTEAPTPQPTDEPLPTVEPEPSPPPAEPTEEPEPWPTRRPVRTPRP